MPEMGTTGKTTIILIAKNVGLYLISRDKK
jgi:hypothetical protein